MSDTIGEQMMNSLKLFMRQVEAHEYLELVGEFVNGSGDSILVVEDNRMECGESGHQITCEVVEVFAAIKNEKQAKHYVDVMACDKSPLSLNGITRIVGYYSRVNNWNKSKIGELRDRAKGTYWEHGATNKNAEERMAVIDNH